MKITGYKNTDELFAYLRANKEIIKMQKQAQMKRAEAISFACVDYDELDEISIKSELQEPPENGIIKVRVVINTTNYIDSHMDVHLKRIWKKSLQEKRKLYLLEQHNQTHRGVISDEVKAFTELLIWKDLGKNYEGDTEALIFDAAILEKENPFMFDKYKNNKVLQHSVGMQYVKLLLCMNSDNKYDKEERENYEKFISEVANRDKAEEYGYFWAVPEAKIIEGSAVLFGSNDITPTISISEPSKSLTQEPPESTQQKDKSWAIFNY
jgi:hypothetical protein